ncbi:MAG: hypothetical protein ACTHJX_00515 [Terriglobales bacterium]|jgi:hypothetical protein
MASSQAAKLGRASARLWLRHRSALHAPHRQHPVARSLGRGLRHFAGRCGNVFAHLGLQISAVLYLAFALSFGFAGWKGWRADHLHPGAHASAATQLELGLTLVFLYFGLSSLLRAAARRS